MLYESLHDDKAFSEIDARYCKTFETLLEQNLFLIKQVLMTMRMCAVSSFFAQII